MQDDAFKFLRSANREHLHFLWEKAKNKDFDDLEDEDRRLAEAMLLHEDEFFNEFEFADVLAAREFDPDSEEGLTNGGRGTHCTSGRRGRCPERCTDGRTLHRRRYFSDGNAPRRRLSRASNEWLTRKRRKVAR